MNETERLSECDLSQLLFDCSELESRLTETINLVNTDDYGKDQLATRSLLTKHQVQLREKRSELNSTRADPGIESVFH